MKLKYELDRIFNENFRATEVDCPEFYDGVTNTFRLPKLEAMKIAFETLFPKDVVIKPLDVD